MSAQVWTLENATPRFEDALKFAKEDSTCLCLQDAIMQTGIPSRTFYELSNTHDYLQIIKEDVHAAIISRINRLALKQKDAVPAAPAIWRMKQLGEKDQQYIEQDQTVSMKQEIIVADQETKKETEKLLKKFQDEIKKPEK